jgi:hypothetical protein
MLFESTTVLLRSIIASLEGDHEAQWEEHVECGNQCIYELFQMSRPERRKYDGHVATVFKRASRAIPHVRLMNRAIRQRDRDTAIKCGRAAVSEMYGIEQQVSSATVAAAEPETAAKPTARVVRTVKQRRKTTPERPPVAKRKSARA